ncbi:MAG: hypothetical protein K2I53_00285 [Lachnospiraceae bacterium]|nr:hypothetical protein [Lachnospiraceae bacterium]
MRVTRNYRDGMVNFRKNNKSSQTSLLQSALSRNSASSRANRLASLLGNGRNTSTSSVANKNFITSASKSQKFYYDMQYHAKQVGEYADALKSTKKDSVYDKARESGSTDQIVSDIKGFVKQYNNMLSDLEESGSKSDAGFLIQLNSMSRASERDLALTGVTRKADGTLVVDEEKLKAADVDTLEKVWGGNGFSSKAAAKASSVEATAELNIEAEKSSIYSPFDRTNLYSSGIRKSGSYFNSRR